MKGPTPFDPHIKPIDFYKKTGQEEPVTIESIQPFPAGGLHEATKWLSFYDKNAGTFDRLSDGMFKTFFTSSYIDVCEDILGIDPGDERDGDTLLQDTLALLPAGTQSHRALTFLIEKRKDMHDLQNEHLSNESAKKIATLFGQVIQNFLAAYIRDAERPVLL